ncbi:MAG: dihydrolipoamide acetyltransferase family protein [Firmicutes bacterium]|nr:dihydrolipoamide acetyltransferase family protein [Bacillota bacterium]
MGQFVFRFPELGEGLHEGRVDQWLVKPGDQVKEDDAIAQVENDKAMVEVPSPVTGQVQEIHVQAGATAVVGDLFITFAVEGAGNEVTTAPAPAVAVSEAGLGTVVHNVAVAEVGALTPVTQPTPATQATHPSQVTANAAPAAPATAVVAGSTAASLAGEVLATPGVRKFAREAGIDLRHLVGSGTAGKITRDDVEAAVAAAAASASTASGSAGAQPSPSDVSAASEGLGGRSTGEDTRSVAPSPMGATLEAVAEALEERVPLTSIRKIIAQAMAKSKYTAPHVTLMDEVDVTELVRFRSEIKPLAAERGVKITYLPFIVKALVAALRRYPQLNASLDEERQELVIKRFYHVGIATDTERGLLVPVVRHADRKSMFSIATEIDDLATKGRAGKLASSEIKGSTISITNIGSAGGLFFTPIINYPEVAILGVGRITEKPVIKNGEIVPAHMMALSLSFDHRIIDGVLGQQFVNEIKKLLENPRLMLLEV